MRAHDHHRGLERVYRAAACNEDFSPTIEIGDGTAQVTMPVDPRTFHGGGAVHGHVLFKALDDAAFFAANSRFREEMVVTTTFHVHFLRPVREGTLRADGVVVSRSRKLVVAEAAVKDDRGREIARGSGTFLPSGLALETLEGYAPPP